MQSSGAEPRLPRAAWTVAVLLLAPFALAWLAFRAWRQTGAGDHTRQRLGAAPRRGDRPLWLHAASVGEVQALEPLLRALRGGHPDLPILVTTFTAAGAAQARAAFGPGVSVLPVPLDLPWCARAFLARTAPRALVIIETEIWPNLLLESHAAGVPVAMVSARATARAARRSRPFRALFGAALAPLRAVLAQSADDAARLQALGAPAARTRVVGNVKWDLAVDAGWRAAGARFRAEVLGGREALVAGSTREGEEEVVLEAFAALRVAHPTLALVLAPRHPERGAAVAALVGAQGLASARRSAGAALGDADVLVLDTLGELRAAYGAATLAFVGGSLKPFGGHNLLEPAALGLPVIAGPHQDNAPDVARALAEAGGLTLVSDAAQLAEVARSLLADPARRRAQGERAAAALAANRGALDACRVAVEGML
jgi:3-deoxy-D-manno-octulosonic-acid transferase